MFKKLSAFLLCLVLMTSSIAFAEASSTNPSPLPDVSTLTFQERSSLFIALLTQTSDEDLNSALLTRLTTCSNDSLLALNDILAAEIATRDIKTYQTLQNGSRGEDVRALQQRLIELNYLSGSADGAFGNKTAEAVKLFQKEVGLAQTGIADPEMQIALFSEDAPVAKVYLNIDYDAMSRDPQKYEGKNYTFSGKVVQVLEQSTDYGTLVAMRVSTNGSYGNIVYVIYIRPVGESRILEDDRITVYGSSTGLYTYETVLGSEISLPSFYAESITLK